LICELPPDIADALGVCVDPTEPLTCYNPGYLDEHSSETVLPQSPIQVWVFQAPRAGEYDVSVGSLTLDTVLSVASDCFDVENSLIATANEVGSGEYLQLELEQGQRVYIVVEVISSTGGGDYYLSFDYTG
jgi:hypothetical protein